MLEVNPELMAMQASPLGTKAGSASAPLDADKLAEASKDFEAVFLKQFISQALKPILHDTPGSQVAGAGVYQHMISDIIADNLASNGDFGFSSMLQAQLAGKLTSDEEQGN